MKKINIKIRDENIDLIQFNNRIKVVVKEYLKEEALDLPTLYISLNIPKSLIKQQGFIRIASEDFNRFYCYRKKDKKRLSLEKFRALSWELNTEMYYPHFMGDILHSLINNSEFKKFALTSST